MELTNKKRCSYDLETGMFDAENGCISELSYWIYSKDSDEVRFKQLYFDTDVPIETGASSVNGLNNLKVKMLSHGQTLSDQLKDIDFLENPDDYVFVGFNNINFDNRYIITQLKKIGFKFEIKHTYDYMVNTVELLKIPSKKFGHKNPNLREFSRYLERTYDIDIAKQYSEMVGKDARFHTALYDSFCLMIADMCLDYPEPIE